MKLFGGLLIAAAIGIAPLAHAAVRFAEDRPPVERAFTCWYIEAEDGANKERSFEVTATADNALRECMKKHLEIRQEANSKTRRT